jgi:hypothetical protein
VRDQPGRVEEAGIEEHRLELGSLAGHRSSAVHAEHFGGQGPTSETGVPPLLSQPRGALPVEVEPGSEPDMADEVVDSTQPIERPSQFTAQHRMDASGGDRGAGDLEHPLRPYGGDELLIGGVRSVAVAEDHPCRLHTVVPEEGAEQAVGLVLELSVGRHHQRVGHAAGTAQV